MRTDSREMLAVGIFGSRSRIGERIEVLVRRMRAFSPRASCTGISASLAVLAGLMIAGSLAPRWIAFAQDQPRLTFEAASVKPADAASTNFGLRFTPGRMVAENAPLRYLITWAYHVRDFQIEGGPEWAGSARYAISAKAEGNANPNQLALMLRSLLEDRFKLKLHRGTEQRTAYLLLPAKGGLKLPESAADCAALADEPPAKGKSKFQCGSWFASDDQFTGTKISMTQFGEWLSNQLERPVVQQDGRYRPGRYSSAVVDGRSGRFAERRSGDHHRIAGADRGKDRIGQGTGRYSDNRSRGETRRKLTRTDPCNRTIAIVD